MKVPFERLLRFKNPHGRVFYGEAPPLPDPSGILGQIVSVYDGNHPWDSDFCRTDRKEIVHEVLSPLSPIPILYCIGLNYRRHIKETKSEVPTWPAIFNKPPDTVAGSLEDIPIAQESKWLDYEGELCAIIGKDCKDIGADENPLDYILGYTVGNDVSSRYWQTPERSTFQAGYAKSFDKFAPCGPYLCSSQLIPDPSKLSLTTKVNGQLRQESNTNDLLFDVPTIVRFLSQGRTLRRGTMIMTGTPSGVALGMADKPWLTDGDVVEVEIEKIGTIRNKFVVQK